MNRWIWIGLAGALGATSRAAVGAWVQGQRPGATLPWGTATVNILGCFLFGLVWVLGERSRGLSAETRGIVLTGFMGAFTTFSTYMFETSQLIEAGRWGAAALNLTGQNLLGLLGLGLGMGLGHRI